MRLCDLALRYEEQVFGRERERRKAFRKMQQRVNDFLRKLNALQKQFCALLDRYDADPSSVTAADWDDIARGSERKVLYIFRDFPRSTWPEGVPYPNVIARRQEYDARNGRLKKDRTRLKKSAGELDEERKGRNRENLERKQIREALRKRREQRILLEMHKIVLSKGRAIVSWQELEEGSDLWVPSELSDIIAAYVQWVRERQALRLKRAASKMLALYKRVVREGEAGVSSQELEQVSGLLDPSEVRDQVDVLVRRARKREARKNQVEDDEAPQPSEDGVDEEKDTEAEDDKYRGQEGNEKNDGNGKIPDHSGSAASDNDEN